MNEAETPVLIVGGSLVGLSAAVFLGARGVPCLVVERHRGTAIHPRAALVNQRTMETYRAVGIEPAIEEAAAPRVRPERGDRLGGKPGRQGARLVLPQHQRGRRRPQPVRTDLHHADRARAVLLAKASEVGARVEYAAETLSLDHSDDGVVATIRPRDGGEDWTVRARYAIAADGAHSPSRERLGIPMLGHGSFSDSITIYFRADVQPLLGDRNLSVIYVFNPRLVGFFRFSIDGQAGFLVVNAIVDEQGNRSTAIGEDMSEDTCVGYVRTSLGAPDLPVQIENVQRWSATADWAERFSDGRIVLAGDSVHVMPPTGGFGGNTGVQDAYDLAWKLAAVLDGTAGPGLLDTYDTERRPVGSFTVEQAYTRYVLRLDPSLGKDDLMPIVDEAAVELGYRQLSGAVRVEDGDDGALWEDPREPTARPGMRAPHLPVDRDGRSSSVIDLFGGGFVLLAGPDGSGWEQAAGRLDVPVTTYRAGADFADGSGGFEDLYGIGREGAALVRPDGFVAWRTQGGPESEGDALAGALDAALARR